MKVSVVIRTQNSASTLGEVLEAVAAQSFGDYEVVLVDSGSTDGTLEVASRYPHTLVKYSQGFHYSGALNAGLRAAEGEYAVCLSSHCVPLHERWLGNLVEVLDLDRTLAGAWGPWLLDRRDYDPTRTDVEVVDLEAFSRQPTRGLQNSNSIIRRELWEERPFSEDLERCEDQDWARHFLKQGYRTAVAHGAPVFYGYPLGFPSFARKTRKNCLTLYKVFGHDGWRLSTSTLARETRWFALMVLLRRRSLHAARLAVASRVGRWLATRDLKRARKG